MAESPPAVCRGYRLGWRRSSRRAGPPDSTRKPGSRVLVRCPGAASTEAHRMESAHVTRRRTTAGALPVVGVGLALAFAILLGFGGAAAQPPAADHAEREFLTRVRRLTVEGRRAG